MRWGCDAFSFQCLKNIAKSIIFCNSAWGIVDFKALTTYVHSRHIISLRLKRGEGGAKRPMRGFNGFTHHSPASYNPQTHHGRFTFEVYILERAFCLLNLYCSVSISNGEAAILLAELSVVPFPSMAQRILLKILCCLR